MKQYTKEELFKLDAVDLYKIVLKGDTIKTFPKGFWSQSEAKNNAAKCTKYLIEKILKYSEKDIKENTSQKMFKENKLNGMVNICFNGSPYQAINNAYPNKYKEWEFKKVYRGCWNNKENGIKATKWLIEEKLKLSDEELKKQLSYQLFKDNNLNGMLNYCFNSSPYEAINAAYPNKYKEWEFKMVPLGYWENKENVIKSIKWLIEEKLELSDEQIKEQLCTKMFEEHKLERMLKYCFNGSPYEAINAAYPNKFKKWEFKNVPRSYWYQEENIINAIKWLIEEKLKLNEDEVKKQVSVKMFEEHGFMSLLSFYFNGSPYEAINFVYPNKYKEWEFKSVPRSYWNKKSNIIKATKWLVEEKLKLSESDLKEHLSVKMFEENGLGNMLNYCFKKSPYKAINFVYPNKYKEWEFKNVPNKYWLKKENTIKATKWLIEEKLKLSDTELKEELSVKLFKENGLNGMLKNHFSGSPYKAIDNAYPNKFKKTDFKKIK